MGSEPEPLSSPRESASNVVEGNSERESFETGQISTSSAASVSLTDEDEPSSREFFEDDIECETSSGPSTSNSECSKISVSDTETNPKPPRPQWRGFLNKLKKAPAKGLQTFHPSMPSLPSIKKLTKKKSRNFTKSMPALPPQLEAEFYCFESSWTNFSLSELENATNNFSLENLIGEGGYSEVYKGHLQDGQLVAIKRLIGEDADEMTSDFLNELGILGHVNHPNISNIIGYGIEGGMHLVLPLSVNGSLASILTGEKEKLEWEIRYNIALGAAAGLSYLHEGCQRRIVHRDIKAANILLTEDFEAQISDFGLAKWLPDQWTHLTVSQYEGTFGYLPPEFFLHGLVDEKTDVYAYGVLLLELITGRPALDKSQNSLVMWAKPLLTAQNIEELVDPSLGAYDSEQLNRMVEIASLCIEQISTERPQMSQVLEMLKGHETMHQGTKKFQKRPAFKRSNSIKIFDEEEYNKIIFPDELNQQNQIATES